METQVLNRLIAEWLALAHPAPAQVRAEWSNQGVALLPLGRRFAAVRLSGVLVYAALDSDDPSVVAEALFERLRGPVIHDNRTAGPTYYALIQWHAGLVWDYNRSAPCLRDDTYLGVPRIDRREPPGTYWVVPPRYDGDLCRPQAVRELVDAGHRQLIQQTLV
ncbi:hypothetical protein ACFYO2_18650 [Streptomyces sp. NPDC006602]|uniref:hypothetical protein n=1 Tax=Streptomyces sp. NPDC006602 TaxID=3364751 RepID=UPI00368F08CC